MAMGYCSWVEQDLMRDELCKTPSDTVISTVSSGQALLYQTQQQNQQYEADVKTVTPGCERMDHYYHCYYVIILIIIIIIINIIIIIIAIVIILALANLQKKFLHIKQLRILKRCFEDLKKRLLFKLLTAFINITALFLFLQPFIHLHVTEQKLS